MEQQRRLYSYNEAIKALNGLQTNASVLKKAQEERLKKYVNNNVQQVRDCLELSGISSEKLNSLKVIHVSGTKGKGSTCAFTESILRHHGLKTGTQYNFLWFPPKMYLLHDFQKRLIRSRSTISLIFFVKWQHQSS